LHLAAQSNSKETAELLIALRAEINAKDNDGKTPFDLAAEINFTETAKLLIAKGAENGSITLDLHVASGSS
jgi:ankyrin repeat protein